MLRASSLLLSLGVHATCFGVVGVLMLGGGDADPVLIAGDAASSGSMAIDSSGDAPAAEPLPEVLVPPSPFEQALPQAEPRPLETPASFPVPEPPPFEPVDVALDELVNAPPAEADAGARLPFAFEPVSSHLLPLLLGPSRPPKIGSDGVAAATSASGAIDAGEAAVAAPPAPPQPPASIASQPTIAGVADTLYAPSSYPRRAVARRIEGTVVLLAQVAADGAVTSCAVESSSGSELLDEAARTSLLRWRFKPRQVDGVERPFVARVPFQFILPRAEKATPAATSPS